MNFNLSIILEDLMPNKTIQEDWTQIRSIIKTRFKKITDDKIASMEDNLELLTESLQSVYGYTKDKAEDELKKIKATIHKATKPTKSVESSKVVFPRGHQRM